MSDLFILANGRHAPATIRGRDRKATLTIEAAAGAIAPVFAVSPGGEAADEKEDEEDDEDESHGCSVLRGVVAVQKLRTVGVAADSKESVGE